MVGNIKVILINPPQTFYQGSEPPAGNLPLGLLYIAAMLDEAGYKVEIIDALMTETVFEKNGDVTQVGMPYKRIKEEINRRKPEVVGISNPFTAQVDNAIKVAKIVKDIDPDILTVVGGPHVSAMPLEFLKQTRNVDIAVIGEGEYTMLDILKFVEGYKEIKEILGITYRKNGNVIVNSPRPFIKNLDKLPYPAYHLVDMRQYLNPKKIGYRSLKKNAIPMITSRGCPFNCIFCSVHIHMGKMFRAHSANYVINHIQYVVEKYGVKTIYFEDDNITLDPVRFESICDKIIERKIKVNWETPNGIRADFLSLNLLKKMKKAGCRSLIFGIESGDQFVLDNIIHKHLKLSDVIKAVKMCNEIGIKTSAFYIIGFPGEKKENMMKTVELALRLKKEFDVGMHLFIATPLYGTKLYKECRKKGYIKENLTPRMFAEVRQPRGLPLITTEDFTPMDVKKIAADAVRKYKRLSLINYFRKPKKTISTILDNPKMIIRFIKNIAAESFYW